VVGGDAQHGGDLVVPGRSQHRVGGVRRVAGAQAQQVLGGFAGRVREPRVLAGVGVAAGRVQGVEDAGGQPPGRQRRSVDGRPRFAHAQRGCEEVTHLVGEGDGVGGVAPPGG
jgi:hypothetical protein